MSKSLDISEGLYEALESRRREDEELEDTLRRLVGEPQSDATGPHPEEVAGIISSETAERMRERIEDGGERDATARRELRERFE